MPRSNGVYAKPAGTTAVPNTVIDSSDFNTLIDDIVADLNAARPVSAGGTGADNAADARSNLGAVNVAGDTMTGDLTLGGNNVEWEAGDYIRWTTTVGLRGFENDSEAWRIGQNEVRFPAVFTSTTASAANTVVSASGALVRSTSLSKYKRNIRPYTDDGGPLPQPVLFGSKSLMDGDHVYLGFATDQVAKVLPEAVPPGEEHYDLRAIVAKLVARLELYGGLLESQGERIAALEAAAQ